MQADPRGNLQEAFREAYEQGRADKYIVTFGWEEKLCIMVICGKSGNATANKNITEAITKATKPV